MRRLAVTGPESTGKSWLSEKLAAHFNTPWVPEYARSFLEVLDRPYRYSDLLEIAQGQWKLEAIAARECESLNGLLFCDTDFLVLKIWSEVRYHKCHPWIDEMARHHRYDLYLLCDIDLTWEYDPLREHPEMRGELLEMYQKLLDTYGFPYAKVSGQGEERFLNALKAIEEAGLMP